MQTSHAEKIYIYTIQARPVIPNACFDKAQVFKKLINNILDSFAKENTSRPTFRATKSGKDDAGNTITKYIADPQRYCSISNKYFNIVLFVHKS